MSILGLYTRINPLGHFTVPPEIFDYLLGGPRAEELAVGQRLVLEYDFVSNAGVVIKGLVRVNAECHLVGQLLEDMLPREQNHTVRHLAQSLIERATVHDTSGDM